MKAKALLFIVLFLFYNTDACELKMRVSDGAPLTFQSSDKEWVGLDVELANALLSEVGCQLDFKVNRHWKRALHHIRRGKIDLMSNLSFTKERAKSMFFIGPIRVERIVLVVQKNSRIRFESLDDFKKLEPGQIGIGHGAFYGDAFSSKSKSDKAFSEVLSDAPNNLVNSIRLKEKRITGFISDYDQVAYRLKNDSHYKDFAISEFVINSAPVYIGFSKKSVAYELVLELKKALKSEKVQETFKTIRMKYDVPYQSK